MFRLSAPSDSDARLFLAEQSASPFSYPEVGASTSGIPKGYNIDRHRVTLGSGEAVWRKAVRAVRGWQMFDISWMRLFWPTAPIEQGTVVAISVRHFGFYSLNACRIVYVLDENGPVHRFGFAYGTLAEHAEQGEERFTVEWNRDDNRVCYEIVAFSRPRQTLAKLGYPLSRSLQKRFAAAASASMLRAAEANRS